jgi:hypothetical protein
LPHMGFRLLVLPGIASRLALSTPGRGFSGRLDVCLGAASSSGSCNSTELMTWNAAEETRLTGMIGFDMTGESA